MVVDLDSEAGIRSLKARLLALAPGEAFEGVKQRDGNNYPYLKGWVHRRRAQDALSGQVILILFNGSIERAVVWIDHGAQPLAVPPNPAGPSDDPSEENAIDLVGEQYFEPLFKDDGRIYICRHMNEKW